MSDVVSLATLTGPAITTVFKFLFDRAGGVLDRRRAAKEERSGDGASVDETAAERESMQNLTRAMTALEVYAEHGVPLRPGDSTLLGHLETVRAELQSIDGKPIDLAAVVRAGLAVEVDSDDVEGTVTGLISDGFGEIGRADVRVRTKTVKAGAEVTGVRIERRQG